MPRNLLLIQDDACHAKVVQDALISSNDSPFKVEWVRSCASGLERLVGEKTPERPHAGAVAAIVVDLCLPDSRGIETFDRLFRAVPHIPILVLCSASDEDLARLAVQRGAQDYLLNSRIDGYLLTKAVRSMVERAALADVLYEERERARVTLNSIGDAVICTDVHGAVSYLNVVAEAMTGWSREEAAGHPIEDVFRIIDASTGDVVPNPMALAMRDNKIFGLTPNCVLVRRDGARAAIEDSAAPIHDRHAAVCGAVMVFRDVSIARAMSARMSFLAQHDSLTELPNRTLLMDRLARAVASAQRHRQQLAVLFLDLDRFKHVNDLLGHEFGDQVLRSVAQRLLGCVRSSDTVSRQGGDEFVIVLTEVAHAQDAAVIADKILLALSEPYGVEAYPPQLSVSIGIATYPGDGADAPSLMKHADAAMYRAKDHGRNNYRFFKPELDARTAGRQSADSDVRHAMAREEFVLHYQPRMDVGTRTIVGVEALGRWNQPLRARS